jgi:hypothetical protein
VLHQLGAWCVRARQDERPCSAVERTAVEASSGIDATAVGPRLKTTASINWKSSAQLLLAKARAERLSARIIAHQATFCLQYTCALPHSGHVDSRAKSNSRSPYPAEIKRFYAIRGKADSPRESLAFSRPATMSSIAPSSGAVGFARPRSSKNENATPSARRCGDVILCTSVAIMAARPRCHPHE